MDNALHQLQKLAIAGFLQTDIEIQGSLFHTVYLLRLDLQHLHKRVSYAEFPQVARLGDFTFIPESWHKPLAQRLVVLRDAPPAARAFYDYLSKPEAQAIMLKYGFVMLN